MSRSLPLTTRLKSCKHKPRASCTFRICLVALVLASVSSCIGNREDGILAYSKRYFSRGTLGEPGLLQQRTLQPLVCSMIEPSTITNIDLKKGIVGSTEEKLLRRIRPFLRLRGSIFIDIGGNQGLFSELVHTVFRTHPGFIFEVLPKYAQKLRMDFPRSSVEHLAVTDGSEKTVKILGHTSWLFEENLVTGASVAQRGDGYNEALLEVNATSLDDFFTTRMEEEIFLLKVDTEGLDGRVLRGASRLLKSRKIQSIFWENNKMQHAIGDSLLDSVRYLHSVNFFSFMVGHEVLYPITSCPDDHVAFRSNATSNIFSVRMDTPLFAHLRGDSTPMNKYA